MNTLTRDLMERVGKAETEKFFVISTIFLSGYDINQIKEIGYKDINKTNPNIIYIVYVILLNIL